MQIYFNGKELELDPNEKIVITMQINDLADLSKSNTSYTNSFKIKKTATNVQAMEYLGVNGSSTRIPYKLNNVSIIENSILVLENGYAEVTDNDPKNYSINIYGAEKNFFEKVKNVTLKDVFPDTIIPWNAANLNHYILSDEVICFPVAQSNVETYHTEIVDSFATFTVTELMATAPHFFVKHLFESIFNYLGYSLSYPLVNDPIFKKLVIPSQRGVSHFQVNQGTPFNIKNCVHEVGCDVLIKEIMYRFGMNFTVDESRKEAKFNQLNTLLQSGTPVDWSDKYDSHKSIKYDLQGYARKNYFLYAGDIQDVNYSASTENILRGQFNIDNERLGLEKTIIESQMQKPLMWGNSNSNGVHHGTINFGGAIGIYNLINVAENERDDKGELKLRENPFQIMYLKTLPGTMNFHMREPLGNNIYNVTPRICTTDFISFQYYIDTYYPEVINLFNNMVVLKAVFKLSLLDVYKLDFGRRIYLRQYGSYFYLNRISNWQNGKLVEVELVQIPPLIS